MATNTTNLSLIKPSGTDKIRIAQINQNMDILDEKIGPVGSASLQAQMSTVTGYTTMSNGTNLNTLTNKANYLVGNISQMLNAPTGAGTSGFFYVEKNSSYILQRFWGDLDKAYRFSYNNGSTWNPWVVHKTQIDSLNSQLTPSSSYTLTPNSDYIKQGTVTLRTYGRLVVITTEGIVFKTAMASGTASNNIFLFTNPTGINTAAGMVSLVRFNSSSKPLRLRIHGAGITPWWEDIAASDNDNLPWYFHYVTFLA